MKKRVGCVFMSMLLFFGIAVMGVDAAGKKQDFTPKTITVKKSYTSSTEKYLNEKKTYRIIKSYDELKQFQKKTQKAYVKANGKQAQSSSSKKVKPGKVKLKQNAKGKIYLQLEVQVKSPGKNVSMTTDMHYYQYFVEANAKDVKQIQSCKVKNVDLNK